MDWVVQGLTEQDLDRLEELVEQMSTQVAAGDPIIQEDWEFHNTLIQACYNPVVIQFASIINNQFFDQVRFYKPNMVINSPRLGMLDIRHRMVLMALRSRDVEAARRAMRMHFLPWPEEKT